VNTKSPFTKAGFQFVTFCMRRSRGDTYTGQGRLCVCVMCVCLSLAAFPHYYTDPDVTWGMVRNVTLVVHYWADLQSANGFRCYDNIAPKAKCQRVLVLALCLVLKSGALLLESLPFA